MSFTKFGLIAALASAVVVAACGGGGGSDTPTAVVAQDVTLPANRSTVAAISGTTVSFPAVSAMGTTGTTTLKIDVPVTGSGSSAALGTPTFSIASGGNTASGSMAFGSCIFVVGPSTFPAGHPLASGSVLTVNPCEIEADTSGAPVVSGTTGTTVGTSFQLGDTLSVPVPVAVSVSPTGAVSIQLPPAIAQVLGSTSITVGTTTVALVTGG